MSHPQTDVLTLGGDNATSPKGVCVQEPSSVVFLFLGRGKQTVHWALKTDQRNNSIQVQLDKTVPVLDLDSMLPRLDSVLFFSPFKLL